MIKVKLSWNQSFLHRTILYLSCVYALGSIFITFGAIPTLNLPAQTMTIIGLLLIGFGSGGIKPCVAAFGGDQFKIPEQAKQLATFFSFFYFSINAGSLISTTLTPILREDVHCFGDLDCFSLAFGVPGALMIVSIVVFVAGKSMYTVKKPEGNVIVDVSKCIWVRFDLKLIELRFTLILFPFKNAITEKSAQSQRQVQHWLDYAEPKFGMKMVSDVKSVLKILLLFVPLPLFWALFDQQGSRWTFQATRMDGNIGFTQIKPDQMQVINPLLILVFIPIFDCAVYPALSKIGLSRPLQKLAAGGYLAALAFLISGLVEIQLEKTYPQFPAANEAQIRIFNSIGCNYSMKSTRFNEEIGALDMSKFSTEVDGKLTEMVTFGGESWFRSESQRANSKRFFIGSSPDCSQFSTNFTVYPGNSTSFFISGSPVSPSFRSFHEDIDKTKTGYPRVRVLFNSNSSKSITFKNTKDGELKTIEAASVETFEIIPATYEVSTDDSKIGDAELLLGGVYTIVIGRNSSGFELKSHIVTTPNSVHMLWQIPQFIVMTAGEVMFSVTGLEFAYSQAPTTMKSLLQACWLLTVAFGNVIVVIIAEAKIFESQAYEFFLFAALMVVDMALFGYLAMRYKYVTHGEKKDEDENAIAIDTRKTFANNAFQED
jgi:solute carrier family 15 (oligopeptide transporter), member 1